MSTSDETVPSDEPDDHRQRRMVTIDKVAGVGEVVMYALIDYVELSVLASAPPPSSDVDHGAALVERATTYQVVRVRRGRCTLLDTLTTERQARAYVRGLRVAAEMLAPKRKNGRRS